jgi:mRNA interferase RelE/StbE
MYRILFTKQADKTLRKMPQNWSQRIREKLVQIAEDSHGRHNNVTKLQDRPGLQLRVGDWRIIYDVEDGDLVVLVLKVAPRGGVYR